MNPVVYTLNLQRFLFLVCGISFISLSAVLVFLDPYQNGWFIWVFLAAFGIFLSSVISLLVFWWFFTVKKEILTIIQVNSLVYQSMISSGVVVLLLVMQQTNFLTLWTGILVFSVYFLYLVWNNSV
jgi:hypothetical protein